MVIGYLSGFIISYDHLNIEFQIGFWEHLISGLIQIWLYQVRVPGTINTVQVCAFEFKITQIFVVPRISQSFVYKFFTHYV